MGLILSILVWIIVGAIAGWLASLLTGSDNQMGTGSNIVIGMVGSIIGGAIVLLFNQGQAGVTTDYTQFNLTSVLVSVLGAVVLILLLKFFRRMPSNA